MPASDDDSLTVGVIRDLIKRVETYEQNSSADRAAFKASIEAGLVQLRRDFHAALAPLQLDEIDHRKVHENDREERITRQATNDNNFRDIRVLIYLLMGLLIGLLIIGGIVMAYWARQP